MKTTQITTLLSIALSANALVAAPHDANHAKRQAGLCVIGRNSPCNGDAWDADGLDGKTWQKWHRFRLGQRSVDKRDPKWGAFGSDGDVLGSLGAWIFGGNTNLFDRRNIAKRAADPKWGAFGSDGDGLGSLGAWIFGGDTNLFDKREAQPAAWIVEEAKRDAAMYGICQVGVKSACNGDAWDGDGLTGDTWRSRLIN